LIAMHAVRREGAVPEPGEHERIRSLALWQLDFRHGIEGLC
jgi:hypothetical protein